MITQQELKEILDYNPDTGIFTWKERKDRNKDWNTKYANKIAGCIKNSGYISIGLFIENKKRKFYAHRLAWLYVFGYLPSKSIDHIDGNPLNNKIFNLREASQSENNQNKFKAHSGSKVPLLGVSKSSTKKESFVAKITLKGKQIYLGSFTSAQDAHQKYLQAKQKLHPYNGLK